MGGGHRISMNTPLNYFKRDLRQFVELVLWEKHKGKQICLKGVKQTSTNDTICHMYSDWSGTLCAVFHTEAFFLCQSHNMPLLFQHQGESSLSFPRNCSLLPTLQWRHKTFSCVIVSQSPKYCSVLSPRQINHEKTASVCFLIASSCPHKHSQTF